MKQVNRLCVFCGSRLGSNENYVKTAKELGSRMVAAGWELVYGGGKIGLMGVLADAVLDAGGKVIGVIPDFLVEREVGHTGVSELVVVNSMHERKATMAELSDGFVALPGGAGTLEEICEIWTWHHLSLHHKPVMLLNTDGFYDTLVQFLDQSVENGFIPQSARRTLQSFTNVSDILSALADIPAKPHESGWTELA